MSTKIKRIDEFDFIRAISAVGIAVGHFSIELQNYGIDSPCHWLTYYPGGGFGWLFVTIFFILSGAALRYRYTELHLKDIKLFYKKRWMSLFPSFYILWVFLYIRNASFYGSLLYKGSPLKFLLTVFGLDGWLSYRVDNYAIIGEWFLGAIVVIYTSYPLFIYLYNYNKWFVGIGVIIALALEMHFNISVSDGVFRNLSSCYLSFFGGMLFVDYYDVAQKRGYLLASLIVICILMYFGDANILNAVWSVHILGMAAFIVLFNIGTILMKKACISTMIQVISTISYQIFLVQHIVIYEILGIIRGRSIQAWSYCIILGLTIVWILFLSQGLKWITDGVVANIHNVNKNMR